MLPIKWKYKGSYTNNIRVKHLFFFLRGACNCTQSLIFKGKTGTRRKQTCIVERVTTKPNHNNAQPLPW